MVVCRLGLVGHLVVGCRFWWGWVWIRRVGRGLPATWNVGRRVGVPGLRNPLPNATYTVDGRLHYTTDAWSRTVRLEVDILGDVVERFRSRSDTVQGHVKDYGNELASKYDTKFNGGHIVGARSGGPRRSSTQLPCWRKSTSTELTANSSRTTSLSRRLPPILRTIGILWWSSSIRIQSIPPSLPTVRKSRSGSKQVGLTPMGCCGLVHLRMFFLGLKEIDCVRRSPDVLRSIRSL